MSLSPESPVVPALTWLGSLAISGTTSSVWARLPRKNGRCDGPASWARLTDVVMAWVSWSILSRKSGRTWSRTSSRPASSPERKAGEVLSSAKIDAHADAAVVVVALRWRGGRRCSPRPRCGRPCAPPPIRRSAPGWSRRPSVASSSRIRSRRSRRLDSMPPPTSARVIWALRLADLLEEGVQVRHPLLQIGVGGLDDLAEAGVRLAESLREGVAALHHHRRARPSPPGCWRDRARNSRTCRGGSPSPSSDGSLTTLSTRLEDVGPRRPLSRQTHLVADLGVEEDVARPLDPFHADAGAEDPVGRALRGARVRASATCRV